MDYRALLEFCEEWVVEPVTFQERGLAGDLFAMSARLPFCEMRFRVNAEKEFFVAYARPDLKTGILRTWRDLNEIRKAALLGEHRYIICEAYELFLFTYMDASPGNPLRAYARLERQSPHPYRTLAGCAFEEQEVVRAAISVIRGVEPPEKFLDWVADNYAEDRQHLLDALKTIYS